MMTDPIFADAMTETLSRCRDVSPLARKIVVDRPTPQQFDRRPEDFGLVNLRYNENPFGGPHSRYPAHSPELLVRRYVQALDAIEPADPNRRGIEWGPHNVQLTRGAADALDLVFRAFFEPGQDAIAVMPPNFFVFDEQAAVHQVACHRVPLQGHRYDRIDVEKLLALPVKGIILCDPNNPTGTRLHAGDIEELLRRFDGLVVIDEAYGEFSGGPSHRHLIGEHRNLVILRTFSKALGMAGLRLGAAMAHPEIITALRRVCLPFAFPAPVIRAAMHQLANPRELGRQRDAFMAERDTFAAALRRCPSVLRVFSDAGFLGVEVTNVDTADAALQRAGIAVSCRPMGWPSALRISIGSSIDNARVIRALGGVSPADGAGSPD
ncbi:pyridoxal phosphate-dependent aminotransferase [Streptomyces erythrochromogenes]|uniref:pyridoxal phosphate-dependent aminotransferase n=1 Tax=Streptomyces erythrochromogenes TaxID=285574 RepID=UPI0036919E56